jgi:Plasma-membrane choline transporter
MGTPVVIQGTAVQQQHVPAVTGLTSGNQYNNSNSYAGNDTNQENRDDKVESSCNDPIFAVLFYIALFAIIGVAATYGKDALSTSSTSGSGGTTTTLKYQGFMIITFIITFLSFLGAGLGLSVLFCIPQFLIKVSLLFTIVMAAISCLLGFASGGIFGGVIGLIFLALTICYAYMVWSRIPFATANLVTACTAVKANIGVTIYAYIFAFLSGIWSIVWAIAAFGVFEQNSCTTNADGQSVCSPSYGLLFVLFLAFFFVAQVIEVRLLCGCCGVQTFVLDSLILLIVDAYFNTSICCYRIPFMLPLPVPLEHGVRISFENIIHTLILCEPNNVVLR